MACVDFIVARDLYLSGMSQGEVALHLGTTQKIICNLFRRNQFKSRKQVKRNQFRELNHMWKGDMASKVAFHRRLDSRYGKPKKCEVCGTTDETRCYDWANLTGKYEDETDYMRMCRSCHWIYDDKGRNFKGAIGGRPSPRKEVQNA